MSEPYILIFNALLLSVGNYFIWWLLFDEEFEQRLSTYSEVLKGQLVKENEEFVSQMQGIIELDPEAVEVVGFGDKWKERLDQVDKLRNNSEVLKTRIVYVYYVAIAAIVFATGGIALPEGIRVTQNFTLYMTAISWWVVLIDVLLMVGLLIIYQLIEIKTVPKTQGKAIKNEGLITQTLNNLRSRGKN